MLIAVHAACTRKGGFVSVLSKPSIVGHHVRSAAEGRKFFVFLQNPTTGRVWHNRLYLGCLENPNGFWPVRDPGELHYF